MEVVPAAKKKSAPRKPASKRRLFPESNQDAENNEVADITESEEVPAAFQQSFPPLDKPPVQADYVLVAFNAKESEKKRKYFAGQITAEIDTDEDLQVSYLRKKVITNPKTKATKVCFTEPLIKDLHSVHFSDIMVVLPKPLVTAGATKRQQSLISFDFNFTGLKLE